MKQFFCYGERKIDELSFSELNLVNFLKSRKVYSSVSDVMPYPQTSIQLVYNSLSPSFGNILSNKYGQVYYKGRRYVINPSRINEVLGTPDVEMEDVTDLDAVAREITGGKKTTWKKQLSASNLTFLYSVLHKVMTYNWVITSNNNVVTQMHGRLLYCLGLNKKLNLGQLVFQQIADIAKGSQLSFFPFPSLIFRMLRSQGITETFKDANNQLFSRTKVRDLPWIDPSEPAPEETSADPLVMVTVLSTLLSNILRRITKLERESVKAHTAIMAALEEILLQVGEHLSSQLGGESQEAGEGGGKRTWGDESTQNNQGWNVADNIANGGRMTRNILFSFLG